MPKVPAREVIWEAAAQLKKEHQHPDPELAMGIRDAKFFDEFLTLMVHNAPFSNSILSAIQFGWSLRERTAQLEAEAMMKGRIHLA